MNYKIIGADGKIYGPVSAGQIRAWLDEGRLESRTPIFAEGAVDWTFVGLLPEFGEPSQPPVIGTLKAGVRQNTRTNGFATAGFILGILSLIGCCCCPFNLLGLIFSIVALVQIRAHPEQEGRGLAIIGVICSSLSLLLSVGFGLIQLLFNPATFAWSAQFR